MTKSDQIRAFVETNPSASAPEIQKALKKEKIKVSLPLIYQVLANKPKTKSANGTSGIAVSVESLLLAKRVAAEIGSIDEARKAISLLAKLGL